jgi:hypothetical protein
MNKTKVKRLFRVILYQINKTPEETFLDNLLFNANFVNKMGILTYNFE